MYKYMYIVLVVSFLHIIFTCICLSLSLSSSFLSVLQLLDRTVIRSQSNAVIPQSQPVSSKWREEGKYMYERRGEREGGETCV